MKKNLGLWDRALRILIGLVILIVALVYHSWWALLGITLILNGLTARCGGYALLGISTAKPCDIKQQREDNR